MTSIGGFWKKNATFQSLGHLLPVQVHQGKPCTQTTNHNAMGYRLKHGQSLEPLPTS